jgi:hypothetical protein
MGIIQEYIQVFNELRNDDDFLTNPGDFTNVVRANVGERIKVISKFRYSWELIAKPSNSDSLTVAVVAGGHSLTSDLNDFEAEGFRVGDTFDFINTPATPTVYAGQIITLVNGNYIEFTNTGTIPVANYTDAEVRGTNQLSELKYKFNLTSQSNNGNLVNDVFELVQEYNFSAMVISGPQITGVPKAPIYWESGSSLARQLATVNTYEQVYEVETILVVPFYKEGELQNLLETKNPFPFNIETQFFKESLELGASTDPTTNRGAEINRAANDTVGYFNENFDGGERQYSVVSIDYEEKTSGDSREIPEITEATKVTVVIASNNTTMAATDPFVLAFSYLPLKTNYLEGSEDFTTTWNYEAGRGLIDGVVVNGTILTNIDFNLDNPNQITGTFDIQFTQAQQDLMFADGNFLLTFDIEDPALPVDSSNRLNLILDTNVFTKNTDIAGLCTVSLDRVYYHQEDFTPGVDGSTNLESWNESLFVRNLQIDLTPDVDLVEIDKMFSQVIAYNPTTEEYFIIQSVEIPSVTQAVVTDSGKQIQKLNTVSTRGFLMPEGTDLNILEVSTDAVFADPIQSYYVHIGHMVNWEYYETLFGADQVFYDETEPNNNLNKKTSNYSELEGYEIRLATLVGVKKNNIITEYFHIQAEGFIYDYDKDKNVIPFYTTSFVVKDKNAVTVTDLISLEENELTVTFDKGTVQTSTDAFEAIVKMQPKGVGGEKNKAFISSVFGRFEGREGNILNPLEGETLLNKSIVAGNFTVKCLIDGTKLGLIDWQISAELQETNLGFCYTTHDGVNEYTNIGNHSSLDFNKTDKVSISFYSRYISGRGFIISKRKHGSPFQGWVIEHYGGSVLVLWQSDTSQQMLVTFSTTASTTSFDYYTVSYDGSNNANGFSLMKNGSVITPSISINTPHTTGMSTTQDAHIGRSYLFYANGDAHNVFIRGNTTTLSEHNSQQAMGNNPDYSGISDGITHIKLNELNPTDKIGINNGTSNGMDVDNIICS